MHMMLAPTRQATPAPRARRDPAKQPAAEAPAAASRGTPPSRPAEPPAAPSAAARLRVCFNSRPDAEDEDPFGRQEALSQDRQGQAARAARLLEPHPREEVAEAQAADGAGRSRSRRHDKKKVEQLLPGRRADEPRDQRRRPQAAQEEGPQAGQGLLGPQALQLPVRERAGHAVGQLRLPRPPACASARCASSGSSASTPPRGARG